MYSTQSERSQVFESTDIFADRHIGPSRGDIDAMLRELQISSLECLIEETVPSSILRRKPLGLPKPLSENDALHELKGIMGKNKVYRSMIGQGYSGCITPPVILRNLLENPGWYTQYTPYQAEIAQGRLESLLNFQTMIIDLTGLPVANASLLDEATAAAEAMALSFSAKGRDLGLKFWASSKCHPQVLDTVRARADALGVHVLIENPDQADFERHPCFGALLPYPTTDGEVIDYTKWIESSKKFGVIVTVMADLLALTLLKSPGEMGADIAIGSTQRFGVPMGFGGPHAAFMSVRDEWKRLIPGRIVGVSKDVDGKNAVRLALQTREQHIRRDKATSNICTAQALLANIAAMYAIYHGPSGLKAIATRIHRMAEALRTALRQDGYRVTEAPIFDTLRVGLPTGVTASEIVSRAAQAGINLRELSSSDVCIALDETHNDRDFLDLVDVFSGFNQKSSAGRHTGAGRTGAYLKTLDNISSSIPDALKRVTPFLTHSVFNSYHSETEMLRYLHRLEQRDLSLNHSMIPLGSCTMKLNATSEMLPITWETVGALHPFAPRDQVEGYHQMLEQLERMLTEITGFSATSLQPNSGAQGEYAGLLVIRRYHEQRGEGRRNVCLIPKSAHGTNPASASMAGMQVVVVECDSSGNIDLPDLKKKAAEHSKVLAALMVTYPSTHGVFEESIKDVCAVVHSHGGQVYMDGANMNAQVGLCRPGDIGADVCHLNLHKTFCIPHGGGGPGMGPICVASHLAPFLPGHSVVKLGGPQSIGAISAAPFGSASILPIAWMYIRMMGAEGLKRATEVAILNANYLAKRLSSYYPILYQGTQGRVAHECIFDLRPTKERTGIEVEDIAKRLMDYGYHAPTVSFPVPGTLMVEPTESESKAELDRFCEAMIEIKKEIDAVEAGRYPRDNNPLKQAPHTAEQISKAEWAHPYSREVAVFPLRWIRERKFWPAVGRINNVLGDRQLICSCPPIEDYQ
jgi:glycine dehydrogenase